MKHIFNDEEEHIVLWILRSIEIAHEAGENLLSLSQKGENKHFVEVAADLDNLLSSIQCASTPYRCRLPKIILPLTCQSARMSLQFTKGLLEKNEVYLQQKLQYELLPILEEAYMQFYFWAYIYSHKDRETEYYQKEVFELASNPYINSGMEQGTFKYDVSFVVLAYNKLEYTKMCVESLLANIPDGLNYELILWDNGSSDGTKAYFESIKPTKLLESRINWAVGNPSCRISEGKYRFDISNDVIFLPNSISNMLECISSDDQIAWLVPSTPNVSNFQPIPAQYQDMDSLLDFAGRNNISNPFRWEDRVRLCNPICLSNSALFLSRTGVCPNGYIATGTSAFPDDMNSLLYRRAGYRQVLAKDAYCFHFGSITLKDEIAQQNKQTYYTEGRQEFCKAFGVDPWGTGFCYDAVFLKRVVGEEWGHVDILGINCGLGSNSLKIKEQIKEYCHNTDTYLSNITDDARFLQDLQGISDEAAVIDSIKAWKSFLNDRTFRYIVWETPFLTSYKFKTLLAHAINALTPGGWLFIKQTDQSREALARNYPGCEELGRDWVILRRETAL